MLSVGRLRCTVEKPQRVLFFSLVDYRNTYFTSNNPEKIIEFYNGFENREQLIQWMRERPKGASYIREVEGDTDIIVVIPTAYFKGKYAKECRENIFKGLHIVFVESGEVPDPYFNYAHNCNLGIKRAMEYNPKWIVLSNDDMFKVDEISKLKDKLLRLPDKSETFVFTKEGKYHSRDTIISEKTVIRSLILIVMGKMDRHRRMLESRFGIKYMAGTSSIFYRFLYKPKSRIKYSGSFNIFSYYLIKKLHGALFDEIFINGAEDIHLSWKLKELNIKFEKVDFDISDIIGGTIGPYNQIRKTRDLVNMCYLNSKIENGELKLL